MLGWLGLMVLVIVSSAGSRERLMTCACCLWSLSRGQQPTHPWLTMGNGFPAPERGCQPPSACRAAACAGPVPAAGAAFPAPLSECRLRVVCAGCRSPHVGSLRQARILPQPAKLLRTGRVLSRSVSLAAAACTVLVPRSRAGGAGLQLQDQCQTAARWGPARSSQVGMAVLAFPGAPGTRTRCVSA